MTGRPSQGADLDELLLQRLGLDAAGLQDELRNLAGHAAALHVAGLALLAHVHVAVGRRRRVRVGVVRDRVPHLLRRQTTGWGGEVVDGKGADKP